MLSLSGGGFNLRGSTRLHSFAGHVARSSHVLTQTALHTRCLAWWRFRQARYHSKFDGIHPKRFKTWRWESQLTCHYGKAESEDIWSNVGWMQAAQERDSWKTCLDAFLNCSLQTNRDKLIMVGWSDAPPARKDCKAFLVVSVCIISGECTIMMASLFSCGSNSFRAVYTVASASGVRITHFGKSLLATMLQHYQIQGVRYFGPWLRAMSGCQCFR